MVDMVATNIPNQLEYKGRGFRWLTFVSLGFMLKSREIASEDYEILYRTED
jgi:hypothetical protein